MTSPEFTSHIRSWYRKNKKRFDFPWRHTDDPYAILVSEIMLQQTQISRVLPKYAEWLEKFPTLTSLAKAPFSDVLAIWRGMGYNRRARYLKDSAGAIVNDHKGHVPSDLKILQSLPGIGHYTARAVSCFAYGVCDPFLETNIRRVLIHFLSGKRTGISDKELLDILKRITPGRNKKEWYWALMDYGREVLGKLSENPNKKGKSYHVQSRFLGSRRRVRAKIVSFLSENPGGMSESTLEKLLAKDPYADAFRKKTELLSILRSLEREKLICRLRRRWKVSIG